ncbi:molybdenum cofactor biosynthesis protein B [Halosegnis sp.]|uniref:MogA/MoaB family molybdenum cofactor biosynthesis protein n=1 Tax=Halosegnis sp. TaxID=2864959 RepID=UPI0035D4707C
MGDDGHTADNHSHGDHGHDHHSHDLRALDAGVLTISSSRSLAEDPAGDAVTAGFEAAGHTVATRDLVGDDREVVQSTVSRLADETDVVVTTGGTGVTPDDVTVEAVRPLFDKELPGFGELFRDLSYEEIGTKVVGTRAAAGIVDVTPVFCLPGSENAARLGTEEIIIEEAPHLAGLARRDG